jgi:hypothetical protein
MTVSGRHRDGLARPHRQWEDKDDIKLQLYMQRYIGLTKVGVQACHDCRRGGSVSQFPQRVPDWLLEPAMGHGAAPRAADVRMVLGAEADTYTGAVGRCWITSMVARVIAAGLQGRYRPGSRRQARHPQIDGALDPSAANGSSSATNLVMSKDFFGVLQGHMLVEISEMHSFHAG